MQEITTREVAKRLGYTDGTRLMRLLRKETIKNRLLSKDEIIILMQIFEEKMGTSKTNKFYNYWLQRFKILEKILLEMKN